MPIVRGAVTLPAGSVIPTAVTAVLDATRIRTDEPDRDRSLESPDFFDAARFPQWTFESTKIVPRGPNAFEMDGDLTIHGVTRPERLEVAVERAAGQSRVSRDGHDRPACVRHGDNAARSDDWEYRRYHARRDVEVAFFARFRERSRVRSSDSRPWRSHFSTKRSARRSPRESPFARCRVILPFRHGSWPRRV